ncbi:MAG TPA: carboxypeptidase regulatory-like domain-containing protein [Acidobacteriaceae bacterium]
MNLSQVVRALPALALLLPAGCSKSAHAPAATYTQIDEATGATLTGTIHYAGKPPAQPVEIDMAQDPACSLSGANMSEQYVLHGGAMANVFVSIKDGLGNKTYAVTRTPVRIDQKGCRFLPHVSGAMVGQQVEFTNSDPTMHNVHMMPAASGNDSFDVSQGPNSGPDRRQFHAPELMIPLRCNNHPWMQAYVNVVSNPFFAVSDAQGHYTIRGLPPGTYTVVADQEQLGQQSATITVAARQSAAQDFTYTAH